LVSAQKKNYNYSPDCKKVVEHVKIVIKVNVALNGWMNGRM
jgi:hypothetical protein